jgi:hypothetical protein
MPYLLIDSLILCSFGILSSLFGLLLPYSTYFPMFLFIRFCGAVCNEGK